MPAYVSVSDNIRPNASADARRERERMARLTFALRHGTAEQRRAALLLKLLPLPEDPEAVAVAGVAVLDLPRDDHSSHAARTAFDPLAYVAARYGGAPQDAEDGDGARGAQVDFSAFMEVLCPDGTSLLESLPLTPCVARGAEVPPSQPAVAATPLASPRAAAHTRAPSIVAALPSFPLESPGRRSTIDSHVDEPPSMNGGLAPSGANVTENVIETLSHTAGGRAATPVDVEYGTGTVAELVSSIFVSGGSSFCANTPRRSRSSLTQRARRRSVSALSPSLCPDSPRRCTGGAGGISSVRSFAASVPGSPADGPLPESHVATAVPQDSLTTGGNWELGGRVLFTDRLVRAHAGTALHSMIAAFTQYVRATTENSDFAAQPSLRLSTWQVVASAFQLESHSLGVEEEMNTQRLAPRQRGIPLKCYGTDNEVLLCVRQAEECVWPTFRRVEPAELYGTSHYFPRLGAQGRSS